MTLFSRIAGAALGAATLVALTCSSAGASSAGASSASAPAPLAATATGPGAAFAMAPPTFQPSAESIYVPLTPCRIVDTRNGTGTGGTPISNLQTRTYYVGGTFGFAPQGGKSGGCGIPVGATAVAATLTAVNPDNGGYLRAWPNGQTEPAATLLNYGDFSLGTGATVSINPNSAYSLKVRNYAGPTDLVIDVSGYYTKQLAGMIDPSGAPYAGSSRIVSATKAATGVYDVKFDRNVRYCAATATAYSTGYYASTSTFYWADTSKVRVYLWNSVGAAVNQYFYIHVAC